MGSRARQDRGKRRIIMGVFRYYVAFYLPHAPGEMVVAEALGFLVQ